jgi:ABC-type Fe3+/spermidine/putrescine transport system ATPase subunit
MLDEPLGALDRALRERLLGELGSILRSMEQTALYVTHDQEEAFSLADRVVVMNKGKVAQTGTPQEIYQQPASEFVARFLGFGNILEAVAQDKRLKTKIGEFEIEHWIKKQIEFQSQFHQSSNLRILLRPDAMHLDGSGPHQVRGTVLKKTFHGSFCRVEVEIRGTALTFEFTSATPLPGMGDAIELSFDPEKSFLFLKSDE